MFRHVLIVVLLIATVFGFPKIHDSQQEERIVGGHDTTIEEHPYTVSLLFRGEHDCGGSIINENTIVTAAHCVNIFGPEDFAIRAGSTIRNSGGVVVGVSEVFIHPMYGTSGYDFDIAVLKLKSPLNFTESIQPIDFHTEEPKDHTVCKVTGWGRVFWNGPVPKELQVVTLQIINREACSMANDIDISPNMICAGVPFQYKGACSGDSGGPLVARGKLAGLASFTTHGNCGSPNAPDIYANVAALHSFIVEHL